MLLISNLKKYIIEGNKYFNHIDVIHHTNNIKINKSSTLNLPNYVLDLPAYIENGQLRIQIWYKNGEYHREGNLPALINYYENGQPWIESWYKNGKLHRKSDLPAIIAYYFYGTLKYESWYKNGILHREGDLPNVIEYCEKALPYS